MADVFLRPLHPNISSYTSGHKVHLLKEERVNEQCVAHLTRCSVEFLGSTSADVNSPIGNAYTINAWIKLSSKTDVPSNKDILSYRHTTRVRNDELEDAQVWEPLYCANSAGVWNC